MLMMNMRKKNHQDRMNRLGTTTSANLKSVGYYTFAAILGIVCMKYMPNKTIAFDLSYHSVPSS